MGDLKLAYVFVYKCSDNMGHVSAVFMDARLESDINLPLSVGLQTAVRRYSGNIPLSFLNEEGRLVESTLGTMHSG